MRRQLEGEYYIYLQEKAGEKEDRKFFFKKLVFLEKMVDMLLTNQININSKEGIHGETWLQRVIRTTKEGADDLSNEIRDSWDAIEGKK